MSKTRISAVLSAAILLSTAGSAEALTWDRRTYFTFSQPVALPGITLPAGRYMFRVMDPDTSRRVIGVTSGDGSRSYAMFLSIPAYRADVPERPEIRFLETASGHPAAVKAWWHPGDSSGFEFIYPKGQLDRFSRSVLPEPKPLPVPEVSSERAIDAEPGFVTEPAAGDRGEDPQAAEYAPAGTPSPDPVVTSDESQFEADASDTALSDPILSEGAAPAAQATASQGQVTGETTRQELPRTASPFAGLLLGGLTAAGFGLRLLRKS
jgi:hypothetical protein